MPFISRTARIWAVPLFMYCLGLATQAAPAKVQTSRAKPAAKTTHACAPGPWGQLSYHYAYLEAPDALLDFFPLPSTTPFWIIDEGSLDSFGGLLTKAGVSDDFKKRVLDPKRMVKMNGTLCLYPQVEDLLAFTPEMRSLIYPELAKQAQNEYHVDPVHITCGSVAEWLADTDLRADLVELISALCWRRGKALEFSDLAVVLSQAKSDQEARRIFKVFTRTRTMVVQLELDPEANADEITTYWTQGLKRKDLLPLLQSLQESGRQSPVHLDVSHLLSPLARKLIYTYPDLSYARNGRFPDCHWTSLNFFNYSPRDYYLNTNLAADAVSQDYEKVTERHRYGDILLFMKGDSAVHSCVYVADNIVYTKNGDNIVSPWILMHLDEVQEIYSPNDDGRIDCYRKKPPQGAN